jgi:two-component system chemotaxis response regulator CheY
MNQQRIMVVDDNRLPRLMVSTIVKENLPEFTILEASNADEALATAEGRSIEWFIIDYNIPGQNGLELAQMLKQKFPQARLSLLTANIQDSIQQQARRLNIHFIPKPVTEENILAFLSV